MWRISSSATRRSELEDELFLEEGERCHGRCGQRLESLRVCDKQLDVELAIDLDLVKIWFVRDVIPDYLYPAAQGIKGS
jgi:hypothetical protein